MFTLRRVSPYAVALGIFLLLGLIEHFFGRPALGPDGKFHPYTLDIWNATCSQGIADPYSFSHILHGILFYGGLWLVARNVAIGWRFVGAVTLETAWELLENSPLVIERYRTATIGLGYSGDSILNSMSDVVMVAIGFWLASRLPVWVTVTLALAMEIGCALWVRDNLTLNIIMLLYPIDAIKEWQMAGRPG